jgi:hypothetical protein
VLKLLTQESRGESAWLYSRQEAQAYDEAIQEVEEAVLEQADLLERLEEEQRTGVLRPQGTAPTTSTGETDEAGGSTDGDDDAGEDDGRSQGDAAGEAGGEGSDRRS